MIYALLTNVGILGGVALISAVVLYLVSQKFKVEPDVLADDIAQLLPQANCGGCGFAGCADFARACAKADEEEFSGLLCPVGGNAVMSKIAVRKGFNFGGGARKVAVLRCQGDCAAAPSKVSYDAVSSCRIAGQISIGSSGCPQGCLHLGDCVKMCKFGALSFDKATMLPVVNTKLCTACGACVKACPRALFELRPLSPKGALVYTACRNIQKGAIARKNCRNACIGCAKCFRLNPKVVVENNLSTIPPEVDADACGAELRDTCPTGAIVYKEKADA